MENLGTLVCPLLPTCLEESVNLPYNSAIQECCLPGADNEMGVSRRQFIGNVYLAGLECAMHLYDPTWLADSVTRNVLLPMK